MSSKLGFLSYLACTLLAVPFLTWLLTSYQFHRQTSDAKPNRKGDKEKPAPIAPYRTPFIGDIVSAFRDPENYVSSTFSKYGWRRPLRVRAGSKFITLISNPEYITAIFKAAKQAGTKPASSVVLRRAFGASAKVASYWDADDSGIAVQPRKGSKVPPELRVHFWTSHVSQTFLAGRHLQALNERFVITLDKQLNAKGIQGEWVEYPDLYQFVQSVVGRSATETLMGPRLLELNPDILDDFQIYDRNLLKFLFGWPRWMARAAYRARDRLLEALEKWHAEAHKKAGEIVDKIAPEDPEFDTYFGSKLIRARQNAVMKMGLDSHDRASLDVGLMFAVNSNVLRAMFWFLLHALRDVSLQSELLAEAHKCQRPDGMFDVAALGQQPLLQSAFAEVCRFYVAIGISRTVKGSNLQLGEWNIPVGETLTILNREAAFNDEAWASLARRPGKPLAEFDAKRFLVSQATNDKAQEDKEAFSFSLEGLAGCWLPFGGGQRMCPGRHFAKSEMLGTFAMLFTRYELELIPSACDSKPDMKWYATGTLPPIGKVPFRIRKKVDAQS